MNTEPNNYEKIINARNCTSNELEVQIDNACNCEGNLQDENCLCDDCGCTDKTKDKNNKDEYCDCDCLTNPLSVGEKTCECNCPQNFNIFE